jgi:16S rRNA (cytosine967-C5)-methyltransferase
VAFDVVRAVDVSDAYANLILPAMLRERRITGRDAAFATELTYGTLRMRGRYDAILAGCVQRPLDQLDPPVRDVLRLGCHQILSMRVPDHAAVSETVALARDRVGAGPAQMVNAVLRRITELTADQWLARVREAAPDDLTALAAVYSHPVWMVRALREGLVAGGRDAGELEDLLAADNVPARVTLAARPGLITRDELRASVPLGAGESDAKHLEDGRWTPTALVLPAGDPLSIAAVAAGRAGVQDEGSQLVALALAATPITGPDERWLDLCAGPGGKAALLGAVACERGASLVANEIAPHRAQLVAQAVRALPEAVVSVRVGDGRELGMAQPGEYDRVLVDVPCTGMGALRRRPEARWRRTPADLSALAGLQRALLSSALAAVRPGGVVAYVTCSPHLAETSLVVDDVLRQRRKAALPGAERLDARAAIRAVAGDDIALGNRLDVQLWPHIHGTDAMHLTLLARETELALR